MCKRTKNDNHLEKSHNGTKQILGQRTKYSHETP